jgi:hypothetical protein
MAGLFAHFYPTRAGLGSSQRAGAQHGLASVQLQCYKVLVCAHVAKLKAPASLAFSVVGVFVCKQMSAWLLFTAVPQQAG